MGDIGKSGVALPRLTRPLGRRLNRLQPMQKIEIGFPLTGTSDLSHPGPMVLAPLMRRNNRNNASPSANRAWGGEALT